MDICSDLLMVHRLGGAERWQSEALEVGSPSVQWAELKKYPPAGESLRLVDGRSCVRWCGVARMRAYLDPKTSFKL